jgi:hypothetical protein
VPVAPPRLSQLTVTVRFYEAATWESVMEANIAGYLRLLAGLAEAKGRALGPLDAKKVALRLTDHDARLFASGLAEGHLRVDERGYLVTRDPYQATAWLVEGNPCWPCWEYLPHAASYVELIAQHDFPVGSVRFETPGSEYGIDADLAVVDDQGRVVVLGEAKKESRDLDYLLDQLPTYAADDPGPPTTREPKRAVRKLAHRLWLTRAPWLWLIGPADRRVFEVSFEPMVLRRRAALPTAEDLKLGTFDGHPRIRLPEVAGDHSIESARTRP